MAKKKDDLDEKWHTKKKAVAGLIHDLERVIRIVEKAGEGDTKAADYLRNHLLDTETWQLKGIGVSSEVKRVLQQVRMELPDGSIEIDLGNDSSNEY